MSNTNLQENISRAEAGEAALNTDEMDQEVNVFPTLMAQQSLQSMAIGEQEKHAKENHHAFEAAKVACNQTHWRVHSHSLAWEVRSSTFSCPVKEWMSFSASS